MMLHKPTILVRRLVVFSGGRRVYDEEFRSGVNVIYGENASGKSTVLDFIFYVLGGENVDWSPDALRCDRVVCEVRLNSDVVTLAREVTSLRNQSMWIYWGGIEEALASGSEGWEIYPYRRSAKDSFSQVLFKALDLPEVPADENSNITMHQLMRLVYQDQMSSPEDIFKPDNFDKELTKETVGELVCGVYDPKLYENRLKLRGLEQEFHAAQSELKSVLRALGAAGESLNLLTVENELEQAFVERDEIFAEIQRIGDGSAPIRHPLMTE